MAASRQTFGELGIPFPLFKAPVEEAAEYTGAGACALCRKEAAHCFTMGIGCDLIVRCPHCGRENGIDYDHHHKLTFKCAFCPQSFPSSVGRVKKAAGGDAGNELLICYVCLRAGRAAMTKDTTLGMIRWEETQTGVTHGRPGLKTEEFATEAVEEDGWIGAKVDVADMRELLRTPTFVTIQGEQWELCCKKPMVYLGTWEREDFGAHAADGDGRALFDKIVKEPVKGLWEDELHDETGIYVFECAACKKLKANWDLA